MDEEIKSITEETALELTKAFEELGNSIAETYKRIDELGKLYMQRAFVIATEKFYHNVEKYVSATFLTRWYWHRKMKSNIDALRIMVDSYNEFTSLSDETSE